MRHNYRNATLLKEEILCLAPRSCNLHAQLHLCLFLFSVHYFMDRQNDSAVAPTRLWLGQEISDIVDYCSNAGGFILVKTGMLKRSSGCHSIFLTTFSILSYCWKLTGLCPSGWNLIPVHRDCQSVSVHLTTLYLIMVNLRCLQTWQKS